MGMGNEIKPHPRQVDWLLAKVGAGHGGCWPFLWVGAGLVCVRACWKGVGVGHAGRTQVPGRGAPVVH